MCAWDLLCRQVRKIRQMNFSGECEAKLKRKVRRVEVLQVELWTEKSYLLPAYHVEYEAQG